MWVDEQRVRAAMRPMDGSQVVREDRASSQWRRADAMITAALRASLAQQRPRRRRPPQRRSTV